MATYRIYFTQVMSTSVEVEAEDLDSAVEEAYQSENLSSGLCAQCSGWGQPWSVDTSGEWQVDESSYEVDGKFVSDETPKGGPS